MQGTCRHTEHTETPLDQPRLGPSCCEANCVTAASFNRLMQILSDIPQNKFSVTKEKALNKHEIAILPQI